MHGLRDGPLGRARKRRTGHYGPSAPTAGRSLTNLNYSSIGWPYVSHLSLLCLTQTASYVVEWMDSILISRDLFIKHVKDALDRYHDSVRLQIHPLVDLLGLEHGRRGSTSASLRQLLRQAITSLRPQASVPYGESEWLGYRLLWSRYIESRNVSATCDELGLSRATYYRYHRWAMQAVAGVLWEKYQGQSVTRGAKDQPDASQGDEQVLAEAVRLARGQRPRAITPSAIAHDAWHTVLPLAQKRGVPLQMEVRPSIPAVYGDPTILRQAFLNVLTEAIGLASRHGLELVASPQEGMVLWRLSGLDAGNVSENDLEEVAGLRAARAMLAICGGRVWLAEVESGDRVVCFTMPWASTRMILVVDDDADTTLLYRRYLEPEYAVRVARGWDEAQVVLADTRPDLVLLDVLMPLEDGWKILNNVRADPHTADIPVVICSVLDQPELALALGAVEVLHKPIDEDTLLQTIRKVLPREGTLG